MGIGTGYDIHRLRNGEKIISTSILMDLCQVGPGEDGSIFTLP